MRNQRQVDSIMTYWVAVALISSILLLIEVKQGFGSAQLQPMRKDRASSVTVRAGEQTSTAQRK